MDLILECPCGKKFKLKKAYDTINIDHIHDLRQRVQSHSLTALPHIEEDGIGTLTWEDTKMLTPQVWSTDWTTQYTMPDIVELGGSGKFGSWRSPSRVRSVSPAVASAGSSSSSRSRSPCRLRYRSPAAGRTVEETLDDIMVLLKKLHGRLDEWDKRFGQWRG